jgi:hypothetical protein
MGSEITKNWGCGRTDQMRFDPDQLEQLHIVTDPKHKLYDKEAIERPLTEEKIANMERLGQLTPILVWLEGKDAKGHPNVLVVNGRQRLKTIREINKRRKKAGNKELLPIFAVPYKGDDPEEAMYAANSIHDEDDTVTKAKKVKRFMDGGHTEADAIVVFGFTRQTLSNMKALMEKATPTLQKAVANGKVTASASYAVAKLSAEKQDEFVKNVATGTGLTNGAGTAPVKLKGRALQRAVDNARGKTTPSARARSVKEWKEMQARATASRLPASAMALIDWALGDDDAMSSYLHDEEEESGGKRKKN